MLNFMQKLEKVLCSERVHVDVVELIVHDYVQILTDTCVGVFHSFTYHNQML